MYDITLILTISTKQYSSPLFQSAVLARGTNLVTHYETHKTVDEDLSKTADLLSFNRFDVKTADF